MDEMNMMTPGIRDRFRDILREVADELWHQLNKRDIVCDTIPVDSQQTINPIQTHVDFLESELFKADTVGQLVSKFRDSLLDKQINPNYVYTIRPGVPTSVMFAETYQKNGLWVRGVSDYFIATDSLIFRVDIIHC